VRPVVRDNRYNIMIINVQGTDIETQEIVSIVEAGFRTHGFVIKLTEGREVRITQRQRYDMYPEDCGVINDKYRKLRAKVQKLWDEDKRGVPTLTL